MFIATTISGGASAFLNIRPIHSEIPVFLPGIAISTKRTGARTISIAIFIYIFNTVQNIRIDAMNIPPVIIIREISRTIPTPTRLKPVTIPPTMLEIQLLKADGMLVKVSPKFEVTVSNAPTPSPTSKTNNNFAESPRGSLMKVKNPTGESKVIGPICAIVPPKSNPYPGSCVIRTVTNTLANSKMRNFDKFTKNTPRA